MSDIQTRDAIHRMIGASVKTASRLSGREAVVSGILSGLRHLREIATQQGGEDAAKVFDDQLRENVLGRILSSAHGSEQPITVVLPKAYDPGRRAGAIMRDVSESCLVLNAVTREEGVFTYTMTGLLDQLAEQLGGMPGWSDLEAAVKDAEPSWTWEVSPMSERVTIN